MREHWNVDHFLKNGGQLFYGSTNLEVVLEWIDTVYGVLKLMGFPHNLLVRVATRAMQRMGKILRDSAIPRTMEPDCSSISYKRSSKTCSTLSTSQPQSG